LRPRVISTVEVMAFSSGRKRSREAFSVKTKVIFNVDGNADGRLFVLRKRTFKCSFLFRAYVTKPLKAFMRDGP
jgi:hypothetical protein